MLAREGSQLQIGAHYSWLLLHPLQLKSTHVAYHKCSMVSQQLDISLTLYSKVIRPTILWTGQQTASVYKKNSICMMV